MRVDPEAYPELDRLLRESRDGKGPFADTAAADGSWSPLDQELDLIMRCDQLDARNEAARIWFRGANASSIGFRAEGIDVWLDIGSDKHCVTLPWERIWKDVLAPRSFAWQMRLSNWKRYLKQILRDPDLDRTAAATARAWVRPLSEADVAGGGILGDLTEADARLDEAAFSCDASVAWKYEAPPSLLTRQAAWIYCAAAALLRRMLTREAP